MNENDIVQAILVPKFENMPVLNTTEEKIVYVAVRTCIEAYNYRDKEDPNWDIWLNGRFTKTVRSYQPGKTDRLTDLIADNEYVFRRLDTGQKHPVVATPPMRYADMPPLMRKMRVEGINYYSSNNGWPGLGIVKTLRMSKHVIFHINPHLGMTSGKLIAQVCHAGLAHHLLRDANVQQQYLYNFGVTKRAEFFDTVETDFVIKDAGFTEVDPGSVTVKIEVIK